MQLLATLIFQIMKGCYIFVFFFYCWVSHELSFRGFPRRNARAEPQTGQSGIMSIKWNHSFLGSKNKSILSTIFQNPFLYVGQIKFTHDPCFAGARVSCDNICLNSCLCPFVRTPLSHFFN